MEEELVYNNKKVDGPISLEKAVYIAGAGFVESVQNMSGVRINLYQFSELAHEGDGHEGEFCITFKYTKK
jgi:hypothetical protein